MCVPMVEMVSELVLPSSKEGCNFDGDGNAVITVQDMDQAPCLA